MVKNVWVTQDPIELAAVFLSRTKKRMEPRAVATSLAQRTAVHVVKLYGCSSTIEQSFRDAKGIHSGMGLRAMHIKNAAGVSVCCC